MFCQFTLSSVSRRCFSVKPWVSPRACIADVISLWEQLEQSGEDVLLRETVSKFKTHPLKATRACHVEHLAKLVQLHARKRLSLR